MKITDAKEFQNEIQILTDQGGRERFVHPPKVSQDWVQ